MTRKLIVFFVTFLLMFNILFSETKKYSLCEPINIKIRGQEEFNSYILCQSQNGLVCWNSSYYYNPEDLELFARFYTYEDVEYIKGKSGFSAIPLAASLMISGANMLSYNNGGEDPGGWFPASFLFFVTGLGISIATIFMPRKYSCRDGKISIPAEYRVFTKTIPEELQDFIERNDK